MSYYFKLSHKWNWLVKLWDQLCLTIGWIILLVMTFGSWGILVACFAIWLALETAVILGIICWFVIVILVIKSPLWSRIVKAMNAIDSIMPYAISVPRDSYAFGRYENTSLKLCGQFHYLLKPSTRIFLIGSQEEWDHFDPMSQ